MHLLKDYELIVTSSCFSEAQLRQLDPEVKKNRNRSFRFVLAQISFKDINLETLDATKNVKEIIKDYQTMDDAPTFLSISFFRKNRYESKFEKRFEREYLVLINNNFFRSLKTFCSEVCISMSELSEERRRGNWCSWGCDQVSLGTKVQSLKNLRRSVEMDYTLGYQFIPEYLEAEELILQRQSDIRLRFHLNVTVKPLPVCWTRLKRPVLKLEEGSILQTLFENESTKDVTIVAANGAEIKCHKLILTAHSNVLDVMMSANMKEAETGVIQLEDMSEEGITQLIRYLYGMEISADDLESDTALELFQASHKYKLSKLEEELGSLFVLKNEKWFAVDDALELYYYSKNLDDFEDLHQHLFEVIGRFPPKDLRNASKFRGLKPEDALELTLKLMEC